MVDAAHEFGVAGSREAASAKTRKKIRWTAISRQPVGCPPRRWILRLAWHCRTSACTGAADRVARTHRGLTGPCSGVPFACRLGPRYAPRVRSTPPPRSPRALFPLRTAPRPPARPGPRPRSNNHRLQRNRLPQRMDTRGGAAGAAAHDRRPARGRRRAIR